MDDRWKSHLGWLTVSSIIRDTKHVRQVSNFQSSILDYEQLGRMMYTYTNDKVR